MNARKRNLQSNRFSFGEELANAISHGIGAAFSIAGLVLLVVFASKYGEARHVVSFTIFGASMVLLYLSSTFNHAFPPGKIKNFFHNFDQVAIFLLIAGTYTPIALVVLKGDWGWTVFGLQWGFALVGILAKILVPNKFEKGVNLLFIVSYALMGWMMLIFLLPILRNFPIMGFVFILIGGACYTLGIAFFKWEKLPYSHLIWHLFVIAGSVCHWVAIISYVLPLEV